ncbi:hypothetical protein [Streptomyces sp. NPDC007905]|uniref:hypothetical protein n=1 Tax=Streptomyces sp. NPDC007905 TaxID=3364788 RepID=UPI0036EF8468
MGEVSQPDRALRRKRGKTDAVDAGAAVRAVLSGRADVTPKTGKGPAADMRVLRLAKESAVRGRTHAKNQLKAVLLGIDPELREALSSLGNTVLVATCADLLAADDAAFFTFRLLARRIQQLTAEVKELARRASNCSSPQQTAREPAARVRPGGRARLQRAARPRVRGRHRGSRGDRIIMDRPEDLVVATWVEPTAYGTRYETLTADGQVHIDNAPPLGEPYFEGEDDPVRDACHGQGASGRDRRVAAGASLTR